MASCLCGFHLSCPSGWCSPGVVLPWCSLSSSPLLATYYLLLEQTPAGLCESLPVCGPSLCGSLCECVDPCVTSVFSAVTSPLMIDGPDNRRQQRALSAGTPGVRDKPSLMREPRGLKVTPCSHPAVTVLNRPATRPGAQGRPVPSPSPSPSRPRSRPRPGNPARGDRPDGIEQRGD